MLDMIMLVLVHCGSVGAGFLESTIAVSHAVPTYYYNIMRGMDLGYGSNLKVAQCPYPVLSGLNSVWLELAQTMPKINVS